jgi:hypothetical protein
MKKLLAVVAVLAVSACAVQADILEIDMRQGNNVVPDDYEFELTNLTAAERTLTGKLWLATDKDGQDISVSVDTGSGYSQWGTVTVPEVDADSNGVPEPTPVEIGSTWLLPAQATHRFKLTSGGGRLLSKRNTNTTYNDENLQWTKVTDTAQSVPAQIEYVPEPATMAMLGLGGLVALRRRRC